MRTSGTLLAIAAAGLIPLTAGSAEAGGSFSIGFSFGSVPPRPPVVHRAVSIAHPRIIYTPLLNRQTAMHLAGHAGSGRYFRIYVPVGQTYLTVLTEGGLGDSDLYLSRNYPPTLESYEYVSSNPGTGEEITVLYPAAGYWYVMVHGYGSYQDVSLLTSWWRQHTSYTCTCGLSPCACANRRVHIYWDHYGRRRPFGGLISFILGRLRTRNWARHHAFYQGHGPRRQALHGGSHRPGRTVRPQVSSPRPLSTTIAYRPSTTVRPDTSRHRFPGLLRRTPPKAERPTIRNTVRRVTPPRRLTVPNPVRRVTPPARLTPPDTGRRPSTTTPRRSTPTPSSRRGSRSSSRERTRLESSRDRLRRAGR